MAVFSKYYSGEVTNCKGNATSRYWVIHDNVRVYYELVHQLLHCISKFIEFFTTCTSLTILLIIGSFVRLYPLNWITHKWFFLRKQTIVTSNRNENTKTFNYCKEWIQLRIQVIVLYDCTTRIICSCTVLSINQGNTLCR